MTKEYSDHRQFFIGITLPPKESAFISELRQTFEKGRALTAAPHITLKPPFIYHFNQQLVNMLEAWANQQESFTIKLNKVGSFQHRKYATVYMAADKGENLHYLESSLGQTIRFLPENTSFVPHLTMANHIDQEMVSQIKKTLRIQQFEIVLKVKSVSLFEHQVGEPWKIRQTFSFQK